MNLSLVYIARYSLKLWLILQFLLFFVCFGQCVIGADGYKQFQNHEKMYSNRWVIEMPGGEEKVKELIRDEVNLTYIGPVGSLDNFYIIKYDSLEESKQNPDILYQRLSRRHQIQYPQQQEILSRSKRSFFKDPLYSQQWYLENQGIFML